MLLITTVAGYPNEIRLNGLDRQTTVGAKLALETGDLAGSEFGHAGIIRVIHVVVYEVR